MRLSFKREGINFLPLPFETFGGLHSQTIRVISKIGRALAGHTGRLESEVVSHLFQRLGILLMKGDSALILSRSPHQPPSLLDGDLDTNIL